MRVPHTRAPCSAGRLCRGPRGCCVACRMVAFAACCFALPACFFALPAAFFLKAVFSCVQAGFDDDHGLLWVPHAGEFTVAALQDVLRIHELTGVVPARLGHAVQLYSLDEKEQAAFRRFFAEYATVIEACVISNCQAPLPLHSVPRPAASNA